MKNRQLTFNIGNLKLRDLAN